MTHSAPWGKLLVGMTLFSSSVLLGTSALVLLRVREPWGVGAATAALSLAALVGGVLFSILGYRIDGAHLYVRRPLWETAVDLRELESTEADPDAMKGSIRTFGNGGLFSFTGRYKSKKLGHYRAFVNKAANAVVLRFPDRTVVLSPGDPAAFVDDLLGHCPQALNMKKGG